jgi:hypothetical protein
MTKQPLDPQEPDNPPGLEVLEPRHGYQGDRGRKPIPASVPAGLSLAISRETGSRGGSIGKRAARKLGWEVYDQELLEYMAQDTVVRQAMLEQLTPAAAAWVEESLQQLLRKQNLSQHPSLGSMARVMLALGAQGQVVLIGRGAGYLLPRATTLHVRIIAPLEDRIAYLSQWQRLTVEEATQRVQERDRSRAEFLATHFHRPASDIHQYDLILNSSLLGEDICADLIAHAARARTALLEEAASEG